MKQVVRLVVIEPGYCPYTASFESIADAEKEVLSAPATLCKPFDTPKIGLLFDSHSTNLPYNRQISEGVTVHGRCIICGVSGEKAVGLSKEQADRYSRKYFLPESLMEDGEIPVAKVKPADERFGRKMHFWER